MHSEPSGTDNGVIVYSGVAMKGGGFASASLSEVKYAQWTITQLAGGAETSATITFSRNARGMPASPVTPATGAPYALPWTDPIPHGSCGITLTGLNSTAGGLFTTQSFAVTGTTNQSMVLHGAITDLRAVATWAKSPTPGASTIKCGSYTAPGQGAANGPLVPTSWATKPFFIDKVTAGASTPPPAGAPAKGTISITIGTLRN